MNSTTDTIRVSTTPTFNAYLRFVMWHLVRQVWFLIPIAILLLICFLLAPLIPFEQEGAAARYRASLGALILPALVFVLLPLSTYFAARKRWRLAADLRAPRTYVFSETGIELLSDSFKTQITWSHVATAYRRPDQILLGTAQKQFYLVSLRDFESPEQLNQFLELVRRKVPRSRI